MKNDGHAPVDVEYIDFLKELLNIGVGKGANILNVMLRSHVQLTVPSVLLIDIEDLEAELGHIIREQISVVDLGFHDDLAGAAKLIFPRESAKKLVNMVLEEEDEVEFDSIKADTLTEIGNVVLNSVTGTISNFLNIR